MRSTWVRGAIGALALLYLLSSARAVLAQEIVWLTDYSRARQAARELNRPLLISFGFKGCIQCRKMYETTLRDPVHTGIITREFVCLKVEADADAYLVEHLKVQVFPTVIFAAPDGTILHRLEGLDKANRINLHIDEALRLLRLREEADRGASAGAPTVAGWRQPPAQSPYSSVRSTAPEPQTAGWNNPPSYWYSTPTSTPRGYTPPTFAPNPFQTAPCC